MGATSAVYVTPACALPHSPLAIELVALLLLLELVELDALSLLELVALLLLELVELDALSLLELVALGLLELIELDALSLLELVALLLLELVELDALSLLELVLPDPLALFELVLLDSLCPLELAVFADAVPFVELAALFGVVLPSVTFVIWVDGSALDEQPATAIAATMSRKARMRSFITLPGPKNHGPIAPDNTPVGPQSEVGVRAPCGRRVVQHSRGKYGYPRRRSRSPSPTGRARQAAENRRANARRRIANRTRARPSSWSPPIDAGTSCRIRSGAPGR
jgi:hypothetical protein